jgi:Protein of unknown function (DUF2783)
MNDRLANHADALITEPNMASPDDFYEALINAHRDLSDAQSHALNAKLVLLLANHVGSHSVVEQALQAARTNTLASTTNTPADASTLDTPSKHEPKT